MDILTKSFLEIQRAYVRIEEENRKLNVKLQKKDNSHEKIEKLKSEILDIKNKNKELNDELCSAKRENTRLKKENEKVKALNKEYEERCLTDKKILDGFLNSCNVRMGKELFVPQKLFVRVFNNHCIMHNFGKKRFCPEFYSTSFSENNIEIREEVVTYKGIEYPKQLVIYGVDIVEEEILFDY